MSLLDLFYFFLVDEEDSECLLSLGGVLGVLGEGLLLVLTDLVLDLDLRLGGGGVGVLLALGGERDGVLLLGGDLLLDLLLVCLSVPRSAFAFLTTDLLEFFLSGTSSL